MEDLTYVPHWVFSVGNYKITLNSVTLLTTWGLMALLVVFSIVLAKRIRTVPGGWQTISELLIDGFYGMVIDALGPEIGPRYFPMICIMFIFLVLCNWIGILPYMSEPTKDINTPLGLGIMGFFIAHGTAIKVKGFKQYIKEYFQPIFFMMPLNVVGEIAKVISISFRLFGNIMGGSIIILVVSHLVYQLIIPPFLYGFFGLFVGTVQAFVFTMLTMVYISVQIR